MSQQFTKELEAMLNASEPVLILNCSLMTSIPNAVLKSRSCVKKLHELCLKNNSIVSLVSKCRAIICDLDAIVICPWEAKSH